MTSPKSDHLPFVYGGMIWDGVTEYQDATSDGRSLWLCRMYGDRTRRFSESTGSGSPMSLMRSLVSRGWGTNIGICIDNPQSRIDGEVVNYHNDGFLQYDGTLSFDPANQFFHVNNFREHAARFAHQLDAAMGHETLRRAEEDDSLTVWNTLSTMIGSAARKYQEWDDIDPQALIVGGNFDGTLRWKRDLDDYILVDERLCGQCDIATFARRFYFKADLPAFRRTWRQGIVYSADRGTDPWSPDIYDVAQSPIGDFYDELSEYFHSMLEHYDHVVGVQDIGRQG